VPACRFRQLEIEAGIVYQHDRGDLREERLAAPQEAPEEAVALGNLPETHHRKLLKRDQGVQPLLLHPRSTDTDKLQLRLETAPLCHEPCRMAVPRRIAS